MPRRKTTWTRRLIRERSWRFSEAVDECLIFCGIDGEDYAEFSGEKDVRILLGRPELDAFVELMESQTAPHPHRVLVLDDHIQFLQRGAGARSLLQRVASHCRCTVESSSSSSSSSRLHCDCLPGDPAVASDRRSRLAALATARELLAFCHLPELRQPAHAELLRQSHPPGTQELYLGRSFRVQWRCGRL